MSFVVTLTRCDCLGCAMRGQGSCGCFECAECGFEALAVLRQDEDSGDHYCAACWPAKRRAQGVADGAQLSDGTTVRVMRYGRWLPVRTTRRRTPTRKVA